MIQTISKSFVKKENVNDFIELFKEMLEPTRKEAGCIQYELYQDKEDPTVLIVLEQWDNKENFEGHLQSEHFRRIIAKMSGLMVKEPEINVTQQVV